MKRQILAFLIVAVVVVGALLVPLGGCLGRVRVRPGVVAERTHEGPDGKTSDSAYYGGQLFEYEAEDPTANQSIGAYIAHLGNKLVVGCLLIAAVIGLGFGLRWVFGRKK
jgi:hypothetical protein